MSDTGAVKLVANNDQNQVQALTEGLHDIAEQVNVILGSVGQDQYTHLVDIDESIGKHVRHIIGFIQAIDQVKCGNIDYDARDRDTSIENSQKFAKQKMVEALAQIENLFNIYDPSFTVTKMEKLSLKMPAVAIDTTFGREVAYVIQHSTHHIHIIKKIARSLGVEFDKNIGVAPSTMAYRTRRKPR